MSKNNHQPLFTLTPEEVKIVFDALVISRDMAVSIIEGVKGECAEVNTKFDNLLTRIKQYQDADKTGK